MRKRRRAARCRAADLTAMARAGLSPAACANYETLSLTSRRLCACYDGSTYEANIRTYRRRDTMTGRGKMRIVVLAACSGSVASAAAIGCLRDSNVIRKAARCRRRLGNRSPATAATDPQSRACSRVAATNSSSPSDKEQGRSATGLDAERCCKAMRFSCRPECAGQDRAGQCAGRSERHAQAQRQQSPGLRTPRADGSNMPVKTCRTYRRNRVIQRERCAEMHPTWTRCRVNKGGDDRQAGASATCTRGIADVRQVRQYAARIR